MKLFVKFVFVMLISLNLLGRACIALPQTGAHQPQQRSAVSPPSQAITAGTVNSGLDFTRNMVDWFSEFMNSMWRTVPSLVTMFMPNAGSGVAAVAGGSAPALPGLPSLPAKQSKEKDSSQAQDTEYLSSLPQIPQFNKINTQPSPVATPRNLPKNDVELFNNEISTDEE